MVGNKSVLVCLLTREDMDCISCNHTERYSVKLMVNALDITSGQRQTAFPRDQLSICLGIQIMRHEQVLKTYIVWRVWQTKMVYNNNVFNNNVVFNT
jgi:hypothetical protein